MSSKRALALWESGVPLSKAWLDLSPESARSEYHASTQPDISPAEIATKTPWAIIGVATHFVGAISKAISAERDIRETLREAILDALWEERLIATAYRIAPSKSAAPVMLDADIIEDADVHWEDDGISIREIVYHEVRITNPHAIILPKAIATRQGRPRNHIIESAIEALVESGVKFGELPRAIACELIRNKLGRPQNPGSGLSDKNLEKYILAKCGKKRLS